MLMSGNKKQPKKLIIVGTNALAEIAYEYFTYDSDYTVVGFSLEKDHMIDIMLIRITSILGYQLRRI